MDPHWSDVVCLAGFESATSNLADLSPLGQSLSFVSNIDRSRDDLAKWGERSYCLRTVGSGGLSVPDNAAFFDGTDSFTIEFWFYLETGVGTGSGAVASQWTDTGGCWQLYANISSDLVKSFRFYVSTDGGTNFDATVFSATALDISPDAWHHFAMDFDGTKYRLYIDGTMVDSTTASHSISATPSIPLVFGGYTDGDGITLVANAAALSIDDVRVTSGVARYASDSGLVVPTAAYPTSGVGDADWASVTLRLIFDDFLVVSEESNARAAAIKPIVNYQAEISSVVSKFGTKSALLTGACLAFPPNPAFAIGSSSYTLEGWFRFDAASLGTAAYFELISCIDYNTNQGWLFDAYEDSGSWYIGMTHNATFIGYTTPFAGFTADTWYHLAVDFDGTNVRVYLDGVMIQKAATAVAASDSGFPLCIGASWNNYTSSPARTNWAATDLGPVAYVDEVRVTIGTARYADDAGFTAPTEAFYRPPFTEETVTETVTITHAELVAARAFLRSISDSAQMTETASTFYGALVRDTAVMSGLAQTVGTYSAAVAQGIAINDMLSLGLPAEAVESVIMDAVVGALNAIRVLEALEISPQLLGEARYNRSMVEGVQMRDALLRFLSGDLVEGIISSDTVGQQLLVAGSVGDSVLLSQTETPTWLLRATATEGIELSAEQALEMIFSGVVAEEVELTGGYFSPDGSFTTWAMNTRTGAVTEYQNYEFNSFAKVGDTYVGASATGLYELVGDDDQGLDIAARIKGGFMQFGSTRLSRLKAAYIATRGEGEFVLRIETGDGAVYDYTCSTRNMRSTKVHMGKGQRARYFAFELISTDGHDFDLDTLEFVPLVVQRRV